MPITAIALIALGVVLGLFFPVMDGAAPESNRASRGLHDRADFEDRLGHRARAAPRAA